jgi:hypothetical protein
MSPTVKKILIIGGAVAAVAVVYVVATKKKDAATGGALPDVAVKKGLVVSPSSIMKIGGIEEELGISEDLGSLGGAFR